VGDRGPPLAHPPGRDHALTYKVGGTHYTLITPRGDTILTLLRSASRLVAPNSIVGALGWWVRGGICGRVRVTFRGQGSDWLGVRWRGAGLQAADYYRLDYVPSPDTGIAAAPGGAPDRGGGG
jgi:hypothetical protein